MKFLSVQIWSPLKIWVQPYKLDIRQHCLKTWTFSMATSKPSSEGVACGFAYDNTTISHNVVHLHIGIAHTGSWTISVNILCRFLAQIKWQRTNMFEPLPKTVHCLSRKRVMRDIKSIPKRGLKQGETKHTHILMAHIVMVLTSTSSSYLTATKSLGLVWFWVNLRKWIPQVKVHLLCEQRLTVASMTPPVFASYMCK